MRCLACSSCFFEANDLLQEASDLTVDISLSVGICSEGKGAIISRLAVSITQKIGTLVFFSSCHSSWHNPSVQDSYFHGFFIFIFIFFLGVSSDGLASLWGTSLIVTHCNSLCLMLAVKHYLKKTYSLSLGCRYFFVSVHKIKKWVCKSTVYLQLAALLISQL